jgi:arylsulfatase A-like enzyme
MGWRDVGFAGETIAETPNLDRYAKSGVTFRNAYASAPNCAPSRACLLSGQYPPRHGVYTVVDDRHAPGSPTHKIMASKSSDSMPTEIVTVAEVLKKAGYATGCFGMWNLGRGKNSPVTPTGQGFDLFLRPQDLGYEKDSYLKDDGSYLADDFTDEALEFIDQAGGRPFFVYLPYHSIHAPFEPPVDLLAKYQRKLQALDDSKTDPEYLASVEALDRNVGRIMADLEKRGIARNTTVVFTSDNGGIPSRISPLKGSKGSLYEGGLKVPAAAWGYGVKASGQICGEVIMGMDFYPTLVELAGLSLEQSHRPDGTSLVPLLRGEKSIKRESVFWHFPCYIGRGSPSSVIRKGDLKLIHFFEDQRSELYDLSNDPNETHDLASESPAVANALRTELVTWWKDTGAALPTGPNPAYEPTAVSKGRGGKGGKRGQGKGGKRGQGKGKGKD